MPRNSNITRRNVLRSIPAIGALTAGCQSGGDGDGGDGGDGGDQTGTVAGTTQTPTEGGPETYEEAREELIMEAEEEGELFIRGLQNPGSEEAVAEHMRSNFDLEVTVSSGPMERQIAQSVTEMNAGRLRADLIFPTNPQHKIFAMDQNAVRAGVMPPAVQFDQVSEFYTSDWDTEGIWLNLNQQTRSLAYNTELVSAGDVPRTYDEFLSSQWEGAFIADTSTIGMLWKVMDQLELNWEDALAWAEEWAGNIGSVTTSAFQGTFDVAEGRSTMFPYAPESLVLNFREARGTPVDWVDTHDIAYAQPASWGVLREAPHPNAARLAMEETAVSDALKSTLSNEVYDIPADPEYWPEQQRELYDQDRIRVVDVDYVLDKTSQTSMSVEEMTRQFGEVLGAPSI